MLAMKERLSREDGIPKEMEAMLISLTSIERQMAGQVRAAATIDEGDLAVQLGFISKAFAIFVAFQIQLSFYELVMLHSDSFNKADVWDAFYVRLIWVGIIIAVMPFLLTRMHKIQVIGVAKRGLGTNARVLFKLAAPMLLVWAFKDGVQAMGNTVEESLNCMIYKAYGTPVTSTCEDDDFQQRCVVFSKHLQYAVIVTVMATVLLRMFRHFQSLSCSHVVQVFANFWVNTSPFALGVGYAWNTCFVLLSQDFVTYYVFEAMQHHAQRHQSIVWIGVATGLLKAALMTKFSFWLLRVYLARYNDELPNNLWQCLCVVFMRSMVFAAAWG